MFRRRSLPQLVLLLAGVAIPSIGSGQDVLLLGQIHGTRPPPAYFTELLRDPSAYQFEREGLDRLRYIQERRPIGLRDLLLHDGTVTRSLGPRPAPIVGQFRFPLVLGLFADSPPLPPYTAETVQREFFDGPNGYHQTIPEFYSELSLGRLQMAGITSDWVRSPLTRAEVTLEGSGLSSHPTLGVGGFIVSILEALDSLGVDWNLFDNTGDGVVDVLTVMHPTRGAECSGFTLAERNGHIWSHRWSLRNATGGRLNPGYQTATPRADGNGFVYIRDYTIQPVLACDSLDPGAPKINQIGVFAHELGHGFGLPDLYSTGTLPHRGAGNWDLMGTGSWGCQSFDPARPCHMGAWSKAMLGWVGVEEVEGGRDHGEVTLSPVQEGRVLRVQARDGSGEYLLLENRQRIGSDAGLMEPGLLIWHIDPVQVANRWAVNAVNNDRDRMGVWLRQADGLNQLAGTAGNRGDRGDPFPGCIIPDSLRFHPDPPCAYNRAFHIGTKPAALTHQGSAFGVAFTEIQLTGSAPHDVRFRMDTRFQWDTVAVEVTVEAARPQEILLEVGGVQGTPPWRFVSGSLPSGFGFAAAAGVVSGTTMELGEFPFTLSAADGSGRELLARVKLTIEAPDIPLSDLTAVFLGRPDPLTPALREFLDRYGNQNTAYDLGDLRVYLQANHGGLP